MGYFSRLAAAMWGEEIVAPHAEPLNPRRPANTASILEAARAIEPGIVQLTGGERPTWAVPSGSNPMHGYVVAGPRDGAADADDVNGYSCTCPWGQPQGPDDRPGVGCKHVEAVILRRQWQQSRRSA